VSIIKNHTIQYSDFPDFRPNLNPIQIFELGSFGGSYWRSIYSNITKKNYSQSHLDLPNEWWKDIPSHYLTNQNENTKINQYKVHSGTRLEYWESKGWINPIDPYGWVQWYCHFYNGRRTEDDTRQIKRWINFSGPKGRWKLRLISNIIRNNSDFDDISISPVIRQGLQHWGYKLTKEDFEDIKWGSDF
tara:strand:+ start:2274 stop:2840 length:567 start_codon:yes stop_codon:yes gene_type:complete